MPNNYTTGTVSVSNGSAVVAGAGTGWAVALVAGGMFSCGGIAVPIASVESDTSLTLAYAWPGANGAGLAYAIARETSEAVRAAWTNDRLAQILNKLSLSAIHPDGAGTLAERNALSPVPSDGYLWLRVETGQPLEIYKKISSGWDGPFALSGASGSAGAPGAAGISAGLPFKFSTTTTMADPGAGFLRLNNATASSATLAVIDDLSAATGSPDVSGFVNTWGRGTLLITKVGSPEVFRVYDVTALTDSAGWSQLALVHRASAGAIANGDAISVQWAPIDASALALKANVADVQTFNANGTWIKPTGAKLVEVFVTGGGGGGGGGPKVAASTAASGGAGGGGGARNTFLFSAADLASSVACVIGAGGAGGAGATVLGDGSNGSGPGGTSYFGASLAAALVVALGGGGGGSGGAGRASGSGGGAGRNQIGMNGNGATPGAAGLGGGMAGVTGGSNGLYQPTDFGGGAGGSSHQISGAAGGGAAVAGSGGGAGGGFSTANTNLVGAGVLTPYSTSSAGSPGQGGAAGGNPGVNGGGGGSNTSGNGGNGGNGTLPGQGGGGGGASQAGNGGNGGAGGPGLIIVITYF